MFRLIATVRRGSAGNFPLVWKRYATLELAREGATGLLREERVTRVLIATNGIPPAFVEWADR